MKARYAVAFSMLLLLVPVFAGADTASSPGTADAAQGWVSQRGANVLVIETDLSVTGTVRQALTDLGVAHDFFQGADFSAVNLSPYDHVFVAMDGGLMENASIQNVARVQSGTGWSERKRSHARAARIIPEE